MGLCIASEMFQEILASKLVHLKNIKMAIDDVLVAAKTKVQHDESLHELLRCLLKLGLTCKIEKCVFGVNEIEFFGMVINEKGIQPKENKIKIVQ